MPGSYGGPYQEGTQIAWMYTLCDVKQTPLRALNRAMAVEERRAHDDACRTSGPAAQQNIPAKTHSKEDSWGAFETADIHKVRVNQSELGSFKY